MGIRACREHGTNRTDSAHGWPNSGICTGADGCRRRGARLEQRGFDFGPGNPRWHEHYARLVKFQNGHCNVKSGDALGNGFICSANIGVEANWTTERFNGWTQSV